VFRSPTFASAARQARSRCLAASGEREGAGTRYIDLESGLTRRRVYEQQEAEATGGEQA